MSQLQIRGHWLLILCFYSSWDAICICVFFVWWCGESGRSYGCDGDEYDQNKLFKILKELIKSLFLKLYSNCSHEHSQLSDSPRMSRMQWNWGWVSSESTSSRMMSSLLGSHSTIHPESHLPSSEGLRYANTEDIGSSSGPCNSYPVHYREQALVILTLDFKIHALMPREAESCLHQGLSKLQSREQNT